MKRGQIVGARMGGRGWGVIFFGVVALSAATARAELRFDQPNVNLGEVWTGRPLTYRFGFVNTGPESMEITDLEASCGCLTPRLPGRAFAAGEHGEVVMEVNTLSHDPGRHTWTLHVHYRLGQSARATEVQVAALVRAEICVQPAALTIYTSGPAGHDILMTDMRVKPLTIIGVRSSCPSLQARVAKEARDAQGHVVRTIRVEVADSFPEGRHDEFLTIATDDPAYPELKVAVVVNKTQRQAITAVPDQVIWQADGTAALPSQLVRLRGQGDQPVIVERVTADNAAITCRWAAGPGPMATLKISIDRKHIGGAGLAGAVHVHVSKPIKTVVTIPVVVHSN